MNKNIPGTRVAAILDSDETGVRFFGYGVYVGDEVPPADVGGMGQMLRENGMKNPRINLDNGGYVFGCECWWMTELEFLNRFGVIPITHVRPDRVVVPEA